MSALAWDQPWKSIAKKLEPDTDDADRVDSAVSSVRNVLKSNWSGTSSISHIFVGGSYAKGTHTKGNLEVDIVVFLREDVDAHMEDIMNSFVTCISAMWSLGQDVWKTAHSVQFKHPSTKVDVDLCFSFTLAANGAYAAFHNELQRGRKRKHNNRLTDAELLADSSASVSQAQVQLVSDFCRKHPEARKSILLAKGLKSRFFDPTHTYLPSYILEILVMYHWRKGMNYDTVLGRVFTSLRDLAAKPVIFIPPDKESHRASIETFWNSRRMRGVLVMDPVNPFMNVAARVKDPDVHKRSVSLLSRLGL